jgi:cation/acetate symporter
LTANDHNEIAVACFVAVIAVTLGITWWAAKRTNSRDELLVAGSRIPGVHNGIAIAGDFMSAATFLGITALFFTSGFDAVIYILAPLVAFAILLFVIVERLRRHGQHTFTDVICRRLDPTPMRILAAVCTLASGVMYLTVQMVGAGALMQVLFEVRYSHAVALVGTLMVLYVALGGMLATTWVQIVKAVLLAGGVTLLSLVVLLRFGFDFGELYEHAASAHANSRFLTQPGGLELDVLSAVSLALAMTFGIAGSPHILMRFLTVPNPAAARTSAFVALLVTSFVFMQIFFVVSVGGVALVTGNPEFLDASGAIVGGTNMVAIHLSKLLGGQIFLGLMSGVTFATILAVVAGLTLASTAALSHDLFANVIRRGRCTEDEEMWASRVAAVVVGVIVVLLAIGFERQNIAYLASLALSLAASTTFPLLVLTMYWRGLTTRGALIGGSAGLACAVLLVVLGPTVWIGIFGFDRAVFDTQYPGIYSIVAAFLLMWLCSLLDRSERAAVDRRALVLEEA